MAPKEIIAPSGDVTSEIVQPLTDQDTSFRFLKDSVATEGNNFLAFASNGCYCFINIMLANVVVKKHALGITVKLYDEAFNCTTVSRSYDGKDDMKLSGDKNSATFDGNRIEFDAAAKTYRLVFKDLKANKEGPKVTGEWLDLTFTADADGFKLGPGIIYYGKDKEDFAFQALSMPRAKVVGKVTIDGFEYSLDGNGFVSKSLANFSPHKLAKTIHHCKFINSDLSLAMCKIQTPKAFDNAEYSWGYLVDQGKLVCATTKADTVLLKDGVVDPESKYVTPTKVQFKWEGKAADGRDFKAELVVDVKKENLLCRFDVLRHVPTLIRVLVEKMVANPIFFQYYEPLEATITVGEETKVVKGMCLHEYHFITDS